RLQLPEAVVRGDLVGLEQRGDAAGELFDDLVLAANHRVNIQLRILEADAVLAEQVVHVPELTRGIQQRLGRNAAHAQAGTAERRFPVLAERGIDAGGFEAQL